MTLYDDVMAKIKDDPHLPGNLGENISRVIMHICDTIEGELA